MRSIFGRSCIVRGRPAHLGAVQAPALLDMERMCGNSGIGHTKKAVGYNARHFEGVEVVKSHLRENPVQGVLDLDRSRGAKEHHLTSAAMKKKFHPAAWILRSSAKPSSPPTTLHFPEQDSLSSSRNFVI